MKIMPYSDYVRSSFFSKEKRKASDDLGSPSKKTPTAANSESPEWSDLSDSDHAKRADIYVYNLDLLFSYIILVVVTNISCEINAVWPLCLH